MAQSKTVTIKLLIDSKAQRVLFGEAGKDFVDFLLTLLSLPIGTVIRLLSSSAMVGSLGKLYDSFETLPDTYIQPNVNKNTLLKPNSPIGGSVGLLSLAAQPSKASKRVFICQRPPPPSTPPFLSSFGSSTSCSSSPSNSSSFFFAASSPSFGSSPSFDSSPSNSAFAFGPRTDHHKPHNPSPCSQIHASDSPLAVCPSCHRIISVEVPYVAPPKAHEASSSDGVASEGFVKGVVTYMVMDDLEVKPMSTISSLALLNKFDVQDVRSIEERIVSLGINEGLSLLKASLQTKTVLTSVFLGK